MKVNYYYRCDWTRWRHITNKPTQLSLVFLLLLLLSVVSGQKGGAKGAMRGRGKVSFSGEKLQKLKKRFFGEEAGGGEGGPEEEGQGAM